MEITERLVQHLERLSALQLDPEARARMRQDLERIVEYVRQLEELDVDALEPTSHVGGMREQPLRPDIERPSSPRDEILANAPDHRDGFYRVPRFLSEAPARDEASKSDEGTPR